ncbi:MAG TPA: T9SS type A sorting domain-containing protein, partial [Bacteroidia bacterium]|nr:T9SS type A sorting domain-containing protein [Bacteroidia bacterium]
FGRPVYKYTDAGFPQGADTSMLAVFLADIDNDGFPRPPGEVYYSVTPAHLIVQWDRVGYQTFDDDLYDNFQVTITNGADSILSAGNNVSYCYSVMSWASADSAGGSGGFFGVPAEVGVSKGDGVHYAQFGAFKYRGYYYYGPYDTNSELYWIENKSFTFNTCVSGNNIAPVIIAPVCSSYDLCAVDTLSLSAFFLCSEKGQKATLTAYSPGLSGLTSDTSSGYSIDSITIHLVAALADTGMHVITIKATDNSSPPLTDSIEVRINISPCGDTTKKDTNTGLKSVANPTNFTVYPNPSHGVFTLKIVNSKFSMQNDGIKIYNVLGQQVYSAFTTPKATGNNLPYTIDLSSNPSGVYFYRVTSASGSLMGEGKLVIQK